MSGVSPAASETEDGETTVEDLEMELQWLRTQIEKVYRPAINERIPDLEDETDRLREQNDQLVERLDALEQRVDDLVGVPEEDASTHSKRVQDAKQILQRRAAATDQGLSSMYWKELASSLAEHGHGELYDTQVKRVMSDVAEARGFEEATGKRDVATTDDRSDVREVCVVRCDLDVVPGSDAVNNVVGGTPGGDTPEHGADDQSRRKE